MQCVKYSVNPYILYIYKEIKNNNNAVKTVLFETCWAATGISAKNIFYRKPNYKQ